MTTSPYRPDDRVQWLMLDLNSYFASVEQQMQPALRGKPVAVVPLMAETTFVIAASYEAKHHGVKTGTRVSDARRMCPGIQFIAGNHAHYIEYHHKIVAAVESCLPVEAVMSIDEVVCRLTGSQQILSRAMELAQTIKQSIYRQVGNELRCSIGLSCNRLLAKVASDMQKPDGLTIILRRELPERLYPLHLRDLPGIGERMEERLLKNGITTIKQLMDLDQRSCNRIWGGIVGDWFYSSLRGEEIARDFEHTRSISHSHVLPPKYRNPQDAYAVAQKLLHKAVYRLRQKGYWCREMTVSMRLKDGSRWSEKIKLPECQDNFTLLAALSRIWVWHLNSPPIKVSVWLTDLIPNAQHQYSLFENEKGRRVSEALDKIQARFGKKMIYFGGVAAVQEAAPLRISFTQIPKIEEEI